MDRIKEVKGMETEKQLRLLSGIGAPSGFEHPAVSAAMELLMPLMDEVWTDRMGSLVGVRRCGKPGAKRLLLDAHLDEIGLIVTGWKDGFLQFSSIGGVDPRMLPNRELTILTDPPRFGLVACLPPHVVSVDDREKAADMSEMFVDAGLIQEEAERLIPIGTPMVFRDSFLRLGQRQASGKAMDDRSCFTALLQTAELLRGQELDVDLYILGSTREEVSGAGAKVLVQALCPDFCVAVDVTHGRTPDSPKDQALVLGGGPVVGIGPNTTKWMGKRFLEKAGAEGIQVQQEVMEGNSGTNGWGMQVGNEGVATAILSLPLKYMHTPVETLELSDVEALSKLLAAFVVDIGKEWNLA